MTSTPDQPTSPARADSAINALRTGHDTLAAMVRGLSPADLRGPSGAAEWSVAQVLSHLGSGAELGLAGLEASLAGDPPPAGEVNHSVWDRWNAMEPDQQAATFLTANETLVQRYESLDEVTKAEKMVDLGWLPPVDVATAAGFRLNEFALHSWDVAVSQDEQATLTADAAEILLGIEPYLLGFIGKPAALGGRTARLAVRTTAPGREFGLSIADKVALTDVPADPDARLTLPAESWIRLVTGRLSPAHTPDGVIVDGTITLDELRQVFPGY